jgi:hypothetical protein
MVPRGTNSRWLLPSSARKVVYSRPKVARIRCHRRALTAERARGFIGPAPSPICLRRWALGGHYLLNTPYLLEFCVTGPITGETPRARFSISKQYMRIAARGPEPHAVVWPWPFDRCSEVQSIAKH